jgi:triacylglycerol lipase
VDPDVASRIAAIGDVVGPETLEASRAVYADAHEQPPFRGVDLRRDLAYGPHERHRLDVFTPDGAQGRAVLLFVHGGGFVRGDKSVPGTPHNENVGLWACRSGMVGVTMNYRLAPEHPFPAGAEDVGAAVAWLRANVADHGGDPDRIVLAGSSAGATHIAGYAAMPELHADGGPGIRGLVLLSGAYDLPTFDDEAVLGTYFGDRSGWEAASPLAGLVASGLPVLVAVAEHDPPVSHRQAAIAFTALYERGGRVPHLVYVAGHNHFTEVFHLNTDDRLLGDQIAAFVLAHAPARELSSERA